MFIVRFVHKVELHRVVHSSVGLGAFAKFRKRNISFVMSVCPSARNNAARILMEFDICFSKNLSTKFMLHYTRIITRSTLHADRCTALTVSRSFLLNRLTPNDPYMGRTAPLTSKCCILYIYSTNIGTEYFKHALYSPFFFFQNAVCFIMVTCLVPVLFTFYIQDVLKLKKK